MAPLGEDHAVHDYASVARLIDRPVTGIRSFDIEIFGALDSSVADTGEDFKDGLPGGVDIIDSPEHEYARSKSSDGR